MPPDHAVEGSVHHELVDLAFDAMFTRSFKDRKITSWNEGAERLYGFSRQSAMGRQPAELLRSAYPVPLEAIEAQLKATGRWDGEIVQRHRDGHLIVVNCRWGLQTDAAGEPYAILEINSDLSAQRQTSAGLTQSEERFRLLVSAVAEYAIFMLDPNGIVTTWNEGARRIKGYAPDEIIGKHFSAFYTPEDRAKKRPDRALETALREGTFSGEGWRLRKDGTRFWASVVITALRDETGELRGFAKVTRDLTDRHTEEENLRAHARRMAELEHAKTQFLDLAAHELRSPLTLIRGYNSMLREGRLPAERIPEIATMLEGKLEQIDLLVQQMLDMGRLETGRMELHLETLDLGQLTRDQISKLRPLATDRIINLAGSNGRTLVRADRARVGTIVANLIENAIKYSPGGGPVECAVGLKGDRAFVSIRDLGPGIAPQHMPLLFKRFSRLPTEANERIPGTGLALYLCQEIAHRHSGEIVVHSTPGQGAEFTLLLPAA